MKVRQISYSEQLSKVDDPEDDNIDVEIMLDGKRYVGSFFTLKNIDSIMKRHAASGESASGAYFCATDMIIVRSLDGETITRAIDDLIRTGDYKWALLGPLDEQESSRDDQ